MKTHTHTSMILIVNDDEDSHLLIQEALQEAGLVINLYFVKNGEELLDYLYGCDQYALATNLPLPGLILLDLNMHGLDGQKALAQIKSDPNKRHIPIIMLTTSHQPEDIFNCYSLGVNSFIVKPMTFDGLVQVMAGLCHYWFEIVSLPT